jgi:hypothetical protein
MGLDAAVKVQKRSQCGMLMLTRPATQAALGWATTPRRFLSRRGVGSSGASIVYTHVIT